MGLVYGIFAYRNMHSPTNCAMLFCYSWTRCARSQGNEMTYRIAALVLALFFALPVAGDVLKDADRMLCVPGQ